MPSETAAALRWPATLACMSYRIAGGRLMRSGSAAGAAASPGKGCIPVICDAGFDGQPFDQRLFAGDVAAELAARGASGLMADFARPDSPVLRETAGELARLAARLGIPLYTSAAYEPYAPGAYVLVGSSIARGSLKTALSRAMERCGGRAAMEVIPQRVDYTLPAGEDGGQRLSEAGLAAQMDALSPMSFFSAELCAKYYTYLDRDGRAHFVLYDDASTVLAKLRVAESCGVDTAFLLYAEVAGMLPELCAE